MSFHEEDGLPAYICYEFDSAEDAMAAYPDFAWTDPDEDADGDVLFLALYP